MRHETNERRNKLLDLNVADIKRYLKNRYPILMLDRIDEIVVGKSARGYKNFSYNEWFFPGHFEDKPNIPRGKKQYFGLSHLHDGFRLVECSSSSERAYRARFTTIVKNTWDVMCRQMAFNIFRGNKLLAQT